MLENETLPVLGYRLYVDTGHKDEMRLVFDGLGYPNNRTFEFTVSDNLDQPIDS
jgi:hypothetical protein